MPSPVNLVTLYYDNVYALSPPVLQCNAMVNTGLFVREWVHREGKREEGGYTSTSKWLTWPFGMSQANQVSVPEAYMCDEVKSLGESSVGPFFTEYLSHAGLGLTRTDV